MTTNTDGAGVLTHDSKYGNIVNSLVAAVLVAVITWLGTADFSSLGTWAAVVGAPAAALVAGLLTSKVLPRFKH